MTENSDIDENSVFSNESCDKMSEPTLIDSVHGRNSPTFTFKETMDYLKNDEVIASMAASKPNSISLAGNRFIQFSSVADFLREEISILEDNKISRNEYKLAIFVESLAKIGALAGVVDNIPLHGLANFCQDAKLLPGVTRIILSKFSALYHE